MKTSKIELFVHRIGPVLSWELFLEKAESNSRVKTGWITNKEGISHVIIEDYPIKNGKLEVLIGCEGREGGQIECKVTIDGKAFENKIVNKTTSKDYSLGLFSIEEVVKA